MIRKEECIIPVSISPSKVADWERDATTTSNKEYRKDDTTSSVDQSSDVWEKFHGNGDEAQRK